MLLDAARYFPIALIATGIPVAAAAVVTTTSRNARPTVGPVTTTGTVVEPVRPQLVPVIKIL